ncbi:hypothetical protein C1646_661584 [Rhizophagus diaphanus]|nr:hypothetical protein C1646_661584 [Rhizophagus diaphanus] [Rhizophagus sp. MUCL 43196]
MGTVADSNEAVRFVGEESEGRVDYTIECIKELIAITEGKQYQIIGFAQLDAFFQKYRIALEVQGAQHRLHSTSWYKDVKKLEDIVNRDRQKRCICQDNGIFLLEVWYDEKPEIVIPERIRKIKEFIDQASRSFDQTAVY